MVGKSVIVLLAGVAAFILDVNEPSFAAECISSFALAGMSDRELYAIGKKFAGFREFLGHHV